LINNKEEKYIESNTSGYENTVLREQKAI